ncbi:hypothetical protein [Mucilaginibacter sp.]|uniref:hypothetical protein n=1 Tax=Mucilaginibacter sp. TaxID=1882438 RepID=UPI00261D898C|nr:hypothetical protein [Mucilaginibacter sp.]MDB5029763.1 hypothetical protein [Mucilaginibacter sp.]
MENYPFDTAGLTTETIDRYNETYKALKVEFNILPTGHIDFNLEQFEVFRNCLSVNLRGSFVIKQDCGDSYILFVEVHYKIGETREVSNHQEYQVWGLTYLKNNFGRAIIRRETLTDKLFELLHPLELDFKEDKAFSNTFYVVVNDHAKASTGMDRNFRNAVMDIRDNDFMIEVVDHTLIIGNYDPIIAEKSTHLAEFVERIASLC